MEKFVGLEWFESMLLVMLEQAGKALDMILLASIVDIIFYIIAYFVIKHLIFTAIDYFFDRKTEYDAQRDIDAIGKDLKNHEDKF